MKRPSIAISLGLPLAVLLGCTPLATTPQAGSSPAPTPTGTASGGGGYGQFALSWKRDLSARAQGVAVVPSGDVYLSVNASYADGDPFEEGGGAMVFSPTGTKLADVPTILPLAFEGATRMVFAPRAPRVASGSVYLGNYNWGLFRINPSNRSVTQIAVNLNDLSTSITGLDANSGLSADGTRAYLTGTKLYVLNLQSGVMERAVDFGRYVRQIVPASGSVHLVNLTENLDSEGTLALWNAETDTRTTFEVDHPVRGIAARDDWAVGVVETGLTDYRVVQWDLSKTPPVEKDLGGFRMSGGNDLSMALRPGKRQVAIGTAGIQAVTDSSITVLTGSTVFIDADQGTIGRADTSSVQGLTFSPNGGMLYVADTGGLKAFALP